MKKTIFKLMMTVLALFMISSCAGSDTSSNGSNTQDNDTGSDVVKHVTVWFDAQQSSITNWYQTIESGQGQNILEEVYIRKVKYFNTI